MGSIHVNTDAMRQAGNRYRTWSDYIRGNAMQELQGLTNQLESDWAGVSRSHYDQLVQQFNQSMYTLLGLGDQIGDHLMNTANQFDNADNS